MNDEKRPTILVVEDEQDIRDLIHFNLLKEGYLVQCAENGHDGLDLAIKMRPDLILLDIMLPGLDGYKVCSALRENQLTEKIPVIMLTAKGAEEDVVTGLKLGADDYVTKPFSPKILLARVETVLRRGLEKGDKEDKLINGHGISIDPVRRKVSTGADTLDLTYTEFQILYLLASKSGWVFSRSQIVDAVRGQNHAITDRSVDVQIVGLRRKLGEMGGNIETVRGAGYRFKEIQ